MARLMELLAYRPGEIRDPPIARSLFASLPIAWFWALARIWLGWRWLEAGRHKIDNPAWTDTGVAVKGYWERAITVPEEGRPPIAFDWYREFLAGLLAGEHYTWFAPMIAWGEVLVGIALILGAFTGVAAFLGAFMNWNFIMAGTASTNPVLFVIAIGVMLAWKVAGYWGVDRVLLPMLGTPWAVGPLKRHRTPGRATAQPEPVPTG